MTVLAKQTTPLALCCLRSVIKVSVSKAICSKKIYTRFKKNLAAKKSGGTTDRVITGRVIARLDCIRIMVLLASHMILISYTDILHGAHVKQIICTPSQHTRAGLTILNVLSSPKQLLLGMHSFKSLVTSSTLDAFKAALPLGRPMPS